MAFFLAIYGLIIFPKGQGYIETAVVKLFQQIQHGSNPSLAILAETFLSLNYCCHNKDECFLECVSLLYIWIRSHTKCEGIIFTKSYLPKASTISKFCKNTWPPPRRRNDGYHLFKTRINYNGWLCGCLDPRYFFNVGIYLGYPFLDHGK